MSNDGTRAKQIRRRQITILCGVGGIVLVVAIGTAAIMNKPSGRAPAAAEKTTAPATKIVTGGSAYDAGAVRDAQVNAQLAELTKQINDFKAAGAAASGASAPGRAASAPPSDAGGPPSSEDRGLDGTFSPPPPPQPPRGLGGTDRRRDGPPVFSAPTAGPAPDAAGGQAGESIGSMTFDGPATTPASTTAPTGSPTSSTSGGAARLGAQAGSNEAAVGLSDGQQAGTYVPAGTFAQVVILAGLDAPTGGMAQSNPAPTVFRVVAPAKLPNGFLVDLVDCRITGNGIGNVSSERAEVRTDRLSCVDKGGGALDIPVRGYAVGEDGKSGIRGTLVTKTGQILANGLLAAVGSGIGQAFSASATTTSTNPLGGLTSTVNPGQGLQAGFGTGVNRSFDQLARYYISLADKTFPIIEVDGARVVEVVFSRGFFVKGR